MPEDPGPPPREPTRQLNVLIPDRLHRKMKIRAATTGVPMKDQVLRWIEQEYGDNDEVDASQRAHFTGGHKDEARHPLTPPRGPG